MLDVLSENNLALYTRRENVGINEFEDFRHFQ